MYLEKCKYVVKEKKMSKIITDDTEISSNDSENIEAEKLHLKYKKFVLGKM